jgi:P2-related tail formation protein
MSVLPSNSGALLKALERSTETDIENAIQTLYAFKSDPHDNLLYWLIWEYGLESVLPYSNDLRSLIKNGLNWQRIRGTPASLSMACGWLGLEGTVIEQAPVGRHFYEYQLNPTTIPGDELLTKLIHIAQLSSPARSRLARIYHGYDIRALHLSTHSFGHLLSDDSGTAFKNRDSESVNVSFARPHQYQATLDNVVVGVGLQRITARHTSASRVMRLGKYPLGACLNNHLIGYMQHQNMRSLGFQLKGRTWLGYWENQNWQQLDYLVASHGLTSDEPGLHQRHAVGVVCNVAQSELHQSHIHTLDIAQELFSLVLARQQQRMHVSAIPLVGQVWLGDWGPTAWRNIHYGIASLHHSSSSS